MLGLLILTQSLPFLFNDIGSLFLRLDNFNHLSSYSWIHFSVTSILLLSLSSKFLLQILHFSDLEITCGSFYIVYISLIPCEYVFLYIADHSLRVTFKSFSADSLWVISQLDSVEHFFLPSLLNETGLHLPTE